MTQATVRTDWQWFEVFGEKCKLCAGIKNLPTPYPNYLQGCNCNSFVAGTQPPKF